MTMISLLTIALCVTSSFAQESSCKDGHGTGFYPNKFNNIIAAYDDSTTLVDTNTAVGDSFTVTTTNVFGVLGNTQLKVFDTGIIAAGNPASSPDLSTYSGPSGDILNQAFITAVAFTSTPAGMTAEVECNHILRSDELNVNDEPTGSKVCYLERMEEDILAWDYYYTNKPTPDPSIQPIVVEEMLVCTWKQAGNNIGEGELYSQVVIGYTAGGGTFAVLKGILTGGTSFGTFAAFRINGDYAAAGDTKYAEGCGSTSISGNSNLFCGKPTQRTWSLNSADQCDSSDSCSNLHPDFNSQKPNCNEVIKPADTCYAQGQCTYTYDVNDADEIVFAFRFEDEIVNFDSWEAIDVATMLSTDDATCVFTAGEISVDANNDVTLTKTWTSQVISDCGATITAGEYQFLLLNYDSNEAMGAMTGNHVYKMGSRQYLVTCRPADLITKASIGVTVGNDVYETTMPAMTPTVTLGIGNKLDYLQSGFDVFTSSDTVAIGRPLYPIICYTPDADWVENVHPYGVRGFSCQIGNTAAFDDKVKTVINADGCTNDALNAFKSNAPFKSLNEQADFGGQFCISMGAIRAARWVSGQNIYFRCRFEFCTNTAYYDDSYCKNSCDTVGNGYDADGQRKRRQVDAEDAVTVQTVIRVTDTTDAEAQTSCADPVMAISAIAALVMLLLFATVIAVFLMLKLQSKRRKA